MGIPEKCPESVFIELFRSKGPRHIVRTFNISAPAVFARRRYLERKHSIVLNPPESRGVFQKRESHPARIQLSIPNGTVIVGSDAHIWPGPPTTAMRAFVHFIKEYKPRAIILNGDVLDMASVSRHPPIGWEKRPTCQDEIEAAQEQLYEIERITPKGCERAWTLGNHDGRFETRIASVAPELAKVVGVHLKDHFPNWRPCWSVWINNDAVITHRFKGGIHATHNNTLWAGKTMVTGHLHSLKVTPLTDYNGTRWGVDSGCLAEPYDDAFDYTEDSPRNWRSGFVVLTFRDGRLLWPELVPVCGPDTVEFRGEVIKV